MARPRVSCLMVTQDGRESYASTARECYEKQTYDVRELVIVKQPAVNPPILGELRNISVAVASGPYVCQWDDDDWFHPERLWLQTQALQATGADVCFLHRVTLHCMACGLVVPGMKRAWEQTMLARKSVFDRFKYEPLPRGEDSNLVERMRKAGLNFTYLDRPDLYLYRVHGQNTWNLQHFDTVFHCANSKHKPSVCFANRQESGNFADGGE